MRTLRFVLSVVVVALVSSGCSVALQGRASLFQRERPAVEAQAVANELVADQRLLEVLGGNQAAAETALVAVGVPRQEATRRIFAALAARGGGR